MIKKIVEIRSEKNMFLGWHPWNRHEVFGLFQKVSDETWWFCGPGKGMSFEADMYRAQKATEEEIRERISFG